ncbi:MAG: DNA alkylation repair protein [Acidobacteriota bacterium]|nr:DNA alkylation repair protein [Acidobacteriota bacterium]
MIQKRLSNLADPQAAFFLQKFFKTDHGEYAEGDLSCGIRVPALRKLARDRGRIRRASYSSSLRSRGWPS